MTEDQITVEQFQSPARDKITNNQHPKSEKFNPFMRSRQEVLKEFDADLVNAKTLIEDKKNSTQANITATLLFNAELLIKSEEYSTAIHLIRQALHLDSNNSEAIRKMIRCLGSQEWEVEQKIQLAKCLVQVDQSFDSYFLLANFLMASGDLDSALENYFEANLRVMEEGPELFESFKNMGNIYVKKGDFEAAEELYHKAFALNPDSDVLGVNMGTLAIQKSDWGLALERFRRAIELNAKNDKAWVGLALCYQAFHDIQMSVAALEMAMDICPSNRTAVHLYANWSLDLDVVSSAINRLQEFCAKNNFDVEMSMVLVHLLGHQGRLFEAKLELEKLLCFDPKNHEVAMLFDEVSKKTGDQELTISSHPNAGSMQR